MTNEVEDFVIPSNPADRKKLKDAMVQISNDMTIIDSYRLKIGDDLKALKEEYEIPLKYLRKMARAYHNQNINKMAAETENFVDLYESIMETND